MFLDFTGFKWSDYIGPQMISIRDGALNFVHLGYIKDGLYTTPYVVNRLLLEPLMGAGILGFLAYIPCLIWAFIKPIFKHRSKKTRFIFLFALVFIINLLSISYLLAYMSYSVRFIMFFMTLSSPILLYSYLSAKNPLKYVIIAFSLFYLIGISTHIWPRPFNKISRLFFQEHVSVSQVRYLARCKDFDKDPDYSNGICPLVDRLQKNISKNNRILAFMNSGDCIYLLKAMELHGYKIDFRVMEDAEKIDFSKYNLIIAPQGMYKSTYIKNYEKVKNEYKTSRNIMFSKKRNLVPCLYEKNINLLNANNKESSYPYQSICGFTQKFVVKNNLEPLYITGFMQPSSKEPVFYVVYRNTKLPLKFKK